MIQIEKRACLKSIATIASKNFIRRIDDVITIFMIQGPHFLKKLAS